MAQDLLAVIYRPSEHEDQYIVFISDEDEFKQWREQPEGQKSIALARFIGNFNIVSCTHCRPGCLLLTQSDRHKC